MAERDQLCERWAAIDEAERTAHADIEEHSRRDMVDRPWTDEDRYFTAIRLSHALARLERIKTRQKVVQDAITEARRRAETTRWLLVSAIVGAVISMILR